MRKAFFIAAAAISLVACSAPEVSDPAIPVEEPPIPPQVRITNADNGKNVFESMVFGVYLEGSDDALNLLHKHYDTLVWSIPALDLSFTFFESGNSYSRLQSMWGTCFFTPGTWNTSVLGYRDGEVVYRYEFPVTVANDRDFLCYDWEDVTDGQDRGSGYHDVFSSRERNWYFSSYRTIRDGEPSLTLYCSSGNGEPMSETMERKLLFDQLCTLYGEPAYDEDNSETGAEYDKLFRFRKEGLRPLCIWITDSSRMVLLRDDGEFPVHMHTVYAEPL